MKTSLCMICIVLFFSSCSTKEQDLEEQIKSNNADTLNKKTLYCPDIIQDINFLKYHEICINEDKLECKNDKIKNFELKLNKFLDTAKFPIKYSYINEYCYKLNNMLKNKKDLKSFELTIIRDYKNKIDDKLIKLKSIFNKCIKEKQDFLYYQITTNKIDDFYYIYENEYDNCINKKIKEYYEKK